MSDFCSGLRVFFCNFEVLKVIHQSQLRSFFQKNWLLKKSWIFLMNCSEIFFLEVYLLHILISLLFVNSQKRMGQKFFYNTCLK